MKKIFSWVLTFAMCLSLGACGEKTKVLKKPSITVDQSAIYALPGEAIDLPSASATDESGKDISSDVTVRVLDSTGTEVYTGKGDASFTPSKAGEYVVEYSVTDRNKVDSDVLIVHILVASEELPETTRSAPVITLDKSNVNAYENKRIVTKAATGYDETDKDVSSDVKVAVYDQLNQEVFTVTGGEDATNVGDIAGATGLA